MSSVYVRNQIKTFLGTNAPTEVLFDFTAQYKELKDALADQGIGADAPFLGLDFIGDEEVPISFPATNSSGLYREYGAIYFHVTAPAGPGVQDTLLTRGETLRNLMRGERIGNVVIQDVQPLNFNAGAALRFENGYISATFIVGYESDLNL